MHTHAARDFNNTGPKQTDAGHSLRTAMWKQRDSKWWCNQRERCKLTTYISHLKSISASCAPSFYYHYLRNLVLARRGLEMTAIPNGSSSRADTCFPPSFLTPTEKHPPITQRWDVVTATRIPEIFEFIGHIEWLRTDAPLGLPRLLIDGGPLRLGLLVKQISQVLAAELIN